MNWTDEELDQLFKEAANSGSFQYNNAYFKDIEAQLPVRKKRRAIFWWMGSAGSIMLIAVLYWFMANQSNSVGKIAKTTIENDSKVTQSTSRPVSITNQAKNSVVEAKGKEKGIQQKNFAPTQVTDLVTQETTFKGKEIIIIDPIVESAGVKVETEMIEPTLMGNSEPMIEPIQEVGTLKTTEVIGFKSLEQDILASTLVMKSKANKGTRFFAEVGGGLSQSPISTSENGSARATTWSVQGGYEFYRRNWSLSAGLGISESYFNNVYIKERSTVYGFGANTLDNQYRFGSLMTLNVPLSISYRLGSHELSGGLTTGLPILSRLKYTEFIDGNIAQEKSGITDPSFFKRLQLETMVNYRFALNKNWQIGMRLGVNLMNPIASDRIMGERTKLPLNGQITLRRTFEF